MGDEGLESEASLQQRSILYPVPWQALAPRHRDCAAFICPFGVQSCLPCPPLVIQTFGFPFRYLDDIVMLL